jgi:hypothetical protein
MRTPRLVLLAATCLLGLAAPAGAATITNGQVTLGVNPIGDLNDTAAGVGVAYNATGNDGTVSGCPCEGWGAGAAGPTRFEGRANEDLGGGTNVTPVSFTSNANSAVSIVDILGPTGAPALRLTQNFHPSPTTANLYEITTTLENLTSAPLTGVRYERLMDWDIEPTATSEFVTINRGTTPPATLIYSDDNGFGDTLPFSDRIVGTANGPIDETTVNANYVDKGPNDFGARFTFSFGTLGPGATKQFFLYYGATGTEEDANTAVSAAALEMYSYGQPSVPDSTDPDTLPDGPAQGKPNTFIWGFRAVGGRAIIPPTLDLTPASATAAQGGSTTVTGTLRDNGGAPIPGAELVLTAGGANSAKATPTTDANGQGSLSYTGANAGTDAITGCLDSNSNGSCDAGEVIAGASRTWQAPQQVEVEASQSPEPVLGKSVVAGVRSGTVRVRLRNGKFRKLGANEAIPLGSEIDATKGRVRLTSVADRSGNTQTADFYKGAFIVTQTGGSKPVTQLKLSAKLSCVSSKKGGAKAKSSAKRKKVRRLWGDGKGRFRTRGRHGAATVRGTKWLTEDRCDSTKITVKRGTVVVRDFVKKKNKVVKKGHSYVARSKKKK